MELIQVDNVHKRYGSGSASFSALNGVSFAIEAGEFVCIVGPSGSGKSTLLNVLAGLDLPSSGRILLKGRDMGGMSDRELSRLRMHEIGFVFQSFNLFPALTAVENVAWPLDLAGASRSDVRKRVQEVLAAVGMGDRGAHHPSELSGGEQQRVAIARALVNRPSIILADEPTGNLDSRTGDAILNLLTDLNARQGVTVVMVTHRPDAADIGSRTLTLCDGLLVDDRLSLLEASCSAS